MSAGCNTDWSTLPNLTKAVAVRRSNASQEEIQQTIADLGGKMQVEKARLNSGMDSLQRRKERVRGIEETQVSGDCEGDQGDWTHTYSRVSVAPLAVVGPPTSPDRIDTRLFRSGTSGRTSRTSTRRRRS